MKKKGQAAEADITSSVDTKALIASYVEDNTSFGAKEGSKGTSNKKKSLFAYEKAIRIFGQ